MASIAVYTIKGYTGKARQNYTKRRSSHKLSLILR
jgi:hypothetical protein